jgi:hypothetical protein
VRSRPCLVVALLALAACSDPAKANGTALFVVSNWDAGVEVTQLFFTGRLMGGSDVFKPSYRPDTAGGPLAPPQSVRVLLQPGFGGSPVTVQVVGYNADGTPAAFGSTGATLIDGVEVPVNVDLLPAAPPPPSDGGSRPGDGGVVITGGDCAQCTKSCCLHVFNTAVCLSDVPGDLDKYACGAVGKTCRGCDPLIANACDVSAGCRCGTGPACAQGQFCNAGRCECGPPSCNGCCTLDGACVAGNAVDRCGSGGFRCELCGVSPVTCESGVCSLNMCSGSGSASAGGRCASGLTVCLDAGTFPFCSGGSGSNGGAAPCKACDYYTSDQCSTKGCVCGEQGMRCLSGQLCTPNGCVQAPQELMRQ